jgi:ectoine hydroxylase
MDPSCLKHILTEGERTTFQDQGFLELGKVLTDGQVDRLTDALDRVDLRERKITNMGPTEALHTRDFLGRDEAFLDLIAFERTIPKVWGILGWNIHIYLAHLNVTPPEPPGSERGRGLSWHQDTGRINIEIETSPRPRLSVKVAFFLSDTGAPGRGNFHVVPGSHLDDEPGWLETAKAEEVPGAKTILAPLGHAVIFDRRLWHSASANTWTESRKAIFFGYGYRWLAPRGPLNVEPFWKRLSPIQQQLCRKEPNDVHSYSTPRDDDVPLKLWIETHMGKHALTP